jgi:hypothetical protein
VLGQEVNAVHGDGRITKLLNYHIFKGDRRCLIRPIGHISPIVSARNGIYCVAPRD